MNAASSLGVMLSVTKAMFKFSRGKVGSVGGAEPGRVEAGDVSSPCLIVSNRTSSPLVTPEPAADVATFSCPGVIREQSPQLGEFSLQTTSCTISGGIYTGCC